MNTDLRLKTILLAGDILMKNIDPEGIASKARIVKIIHHLDSRMGPGIEAFLEFPMRTTLAIHCRFQKNDDLIIDKCRLVTSSFIKEINVTPSGSLLKTLKSLSDIPAQLKCNLSRIGLKDAKKEKSDDKYGRELLKTAIDALFWEMDSPEINEKEKAEFKEITLLLREDKAELIGTCHIDKGRIIAKTTVDVYGIGSKSVAVEKKMGNRHELSAYCYTKDSQGKRIPSIRMAFRINTIMNGTDTFERKDSVKKELPYNKKRL